jgi:hypothetical protein
MSTDLLNATNALDAIASFLLSYWQPVPLHQAVGGWNMPPIGVRDMSFRASRLSSKLKGLKEEDLTEDLLEQLRGLPERLNWFRDNSLPNLPGGNAPQVLVAYDALLASIEQGLPAPKPPWETIDGANVIPKALARRIRGIEAVVDDLEPRSKSLSDMLDEIRQAHTAASELPTDLHSLREARQRLAEYERQVSEIVSQVEAERGTVSALLKNITDDESAAKKLMSNIDSAYSASTTVGLAASFKERADALSASTWGWVVMLIFALFAGGWLGHIRLVEFQGLADKPNVDAKWIWLNAVMSVMAIAAPVWFAWLATRQISQRFRLAEDYGFKASVARAYEGYRREAARLDPALEGRLFASALDRLDEAPLRFLAVEEHSSPYEALLESKGFQAFLEKFPDAREHLSALIAKFPSVPTPVAEPGVRSRATKRVSSEGEGE